MQVYQIQKYANPVKGTLIAINLDTMHSLNFLEISKPYRRHGKVSTSIITPKILMERKQKAFNKNIPDDST